MAAELTPLQSIQDNIRDRIKAEFVNLIPDEAWTAMVQSVVTEFTTDTRDRYNSSLPHTSPMKAMIRGELEAIAKGHLKTELDRLAVGSWNASGQQIASEAIRTLIAEHFPAILASVQAGMVEMAVMTATNHMRNAMQRIG